MRIEDLRKITESAPIETLRNGTYFMIHNKLYMKVEQNRTNMVDIYSGLKYGLNGEERVVPVKKVVLKRTEKDITNICNIMKGELFEYEDVVYMKLDNGHEILNLEDGTIIEIPSTMEKVTELDSECLIY